MALTTGLGPAIVAEAAAVPLAYGGGFGAIAVDPVHGRVFVSMPQARAVAVADSAGTVFQLLDVDGEPGSLLVDGDRLYVLRYFPAAIEVFDTATLTRVGTLGGGGRLDSAFHLVKAAGRLWTVTGGCGEQTTLASIDPATDEVRTYGSGLTGCANLAGSPADPNLLMAWDGAWPPNVVRFDVSGSEPTVAAQSRLEGHENVAQIAFAPGGQSFVVAAYSPFRTTQFHTADLTPEGAGYPTGPYGASVAVHGERIAVASGTGIEVVPVNDPYSVLFAQPVEGLARRGLAWSATGSTLYAVTVDSSTSTAQLHALPVTGTPKLRTTTVLETSSPAAVYGEKFTIKATVSAQAPGAPVPAGTVSFYNGSNFIAKIALRNGQATLGPRTMPLGTNWVTASYSGNAGNQPSVSTPLGQVVNRAGTLTALTSSPNPSAPGQAVTLQAAVTVVAPGAGQPAEKVSFYDGTRLIGTARVAQGVAVLATTSLATGSRSLSATYAGSARFEPSTSAAVTHNVV